MNFHTKQIDFIYIFNHFNMNNIEVPSRIKILENILRSLNPLLPNGNYSYSLIKISFSKKEEIKKKLSYERRVYDSVDDENLS